jgi:hypothetical protein
MSMTKFIRKAVAPTSPSLPLSFVAVLSALAASGCAGESESSQRE